MARRTRRTVKVGKRRDGTRRSGDGGIRSGADGAGWHIIRSPRRTAVFEDGDNVTVGQPFKLVGTVPAEAAFGFDPNLQIKSNPTIKR